MHAIFKNLFCNFLASICILTISFGQERSNYDKALADSLGADAYGMKAYVFVILKTGDNNVTDKSLRDSLFRGHMNNIQKLAKENKLIIAGPFQKNDHNYRGIFILNVKTIDEAKPLVEADPAVSNRMFATDYFVWYGSAAIPVYLPIHKKIEKDNF